MKQVGLLHTLRASDWGAYVGKGLSRRGYEPVGMATDLRAVFDGKVLSPDLPCVVMLWTRDAVTSLHMSVVAKAAREREALINVLIEPVTPTIATAAEPIDLTGAVWPKRPRGPHWRALLKRIGAMH